MRRLAIAGLVGAAAGLLPAGFTAQSSDRPSVVAFTGVDVVPMDRERVESNWTIVVRDGRISAAGPSSSVSVPDGAVRVDGSGKVLIPALAEMHAHIPPGPQVPDAVIERTLFMYAAGGIGTIRGMLGHERHLAYRDRARKGELLSPLIYTSGPSFDGNSTPNPDAAVKLVTEQKQAGYDFRRFTRVSRETRSTRWRRLQASWTSALRATCPRRSACSVPSKRGTTPSTTWMDISRRSPATVRRRPSGSASI
jgi:hypothetical protein